MSNKNILFMFLNQQILYLENADIDFREWCEQLGVNMDDFDSIIKGIISDKMIVFFKGINYQYDDEVIKVAKKYGTKIKEDVSRPDLDIYCGMLNNGYGNKWEPILKINKDEISSKLDFDDNIKQSENTDTNVEEELPILEFKNNYQDDGFIAIAIKYTFITLLIDIVLKLLLFLRGRILHLNNPADMLLVFLQIILLLMCLIGYKKRLDKTKYLGLIASFFIIITLDLGDVLLGVFYFLFTLNLNYIYNIRTSVKDGYKIIKDKTVNIKIKKRKR